MVADESITAYRDFPNSFAKCFVSDVKWAILRISHFPKLSLLYDNISQKNFSIKLHRNSIAQSQFSVVRIS